MLEENNIYLGDCLELMKQIPDKSIDCVITDPPYGIGEDGGKFRDRKGGGHRVLEKISWDKETPSKEYFNEILRISKNQIIFGGNYFTDKLPVSRGWIYWDKLMGGDFSDGELAWTSFDRVLKKYTLCNKMGGKEHPTQKPIELLKWILKNYTNENDLILDPFLGSGTTAIACYDLKRRYIGIEKEPKYYDIAKKRIEQFKAQGRLF